MRPFRTRDRPLVRTETQIPFRLGGEFLQTVGAAIEAHVIAPLQRFYVFRADAVYPRGNASAVFANIGIHAARECIEKAINYGINLCFVIDDTLPRSQ
jgi:uncharacterized oligopeptide transporter (OPT) family protein